MNKYPAIIAVMAAASLTALYSGIPEVRQVVISGTVMDDPYPAKRLPFPVPDAKLTLWLQSTLVDAPADASGRIFPLWQQVDSTVSDGKGAFKFQPHAGSNWQIRCMHPEFAPRQISVSSTKDTAVQVIIVSNDAMATVAGSVYASCRDPLGMPCIMPPVAGCTVTIARVLLSPASATDALVVITVTDEEGRYTAGKLPLSYNGERVIVTARKAGFVTKSVDTVIRNMTTTTVNFVLDANTLVSGDTVIVTPAAPTTGDKLEFLLKNRGHCCATAFTEKTVTVRDTVILLSYVYNDSICPLVNCLIAGSQTVFTSNPLKQGRYAIYKVESPYCPPPRLCDPAVIAPVRVGSLTVSNALAASPASPVAVNAGNRLTVTGMTIAATIGRSGPVFLRVHDARGALLDEVKFGHMRAGAVLYHDLGAKGGNGLRIIRLSTGEAVTTVTVVTGSR